MALAAFLLLSLLPPLALGCSCPVGPTPSERETIRLGLCSNSSDLVPYVGRVVGVVCSCSQTDRGSGQPIPDDEEFSCQSYSLDESDTEVLNYEVIARSFCSRTSADVVNVQPCSQRNVQIANGLTLQDVTQNLPGVVNNSADLNCGYTCPFNSKMDGDDVQHFYTNNAFQPCSYTLEIIELFKDSSYEVGDTVIDSGPDVLTSCGASGRVLSAGDEFVVGIGGVCAPISYWSSVESFGDGNLEYLREFAREYQQNATSACEASSSTLAFPPSFLLLLIAAIAVSIL